MHKNSFCSLCCFELVGDSVSKTKNSECNKQCTTKIREEVPKEKPAQGLKIASSCDENDGDIKAEGGEINELAITFCSDAKMS